MKNKKKSADFGQRIFLYGGKFVIFKLQPVAYIDAEGQQGDGNFGNHTGIVVFDEGVITTDVNDSTIHGSLLIG